MVNMLLPTVCCCQQNRFRTTLKDIRCCSNLTVEHALHRNEMEDIDLDALANDLGFVLKSELLDCFSVITKLMGF